jgi:methylmalonyl-CoA mutase
MSNNLSLAAEFPPTTEADWRKLVEATLKGARYDKRLVSQTHDGIRIEPLYSRAAGAKPVPGRKAGTAWTVMQQVNHPDPVAANAQALQDLRDGANGLAIIFAGAPASRGFGMVVSSEDGLDHALKHILLDLVSIRIETAPFAGCTVATLITAVLEKRPVDPAKVMIDFGLDPIGDMARTGASLLPWPALSERAGETARELRAKGFDKAHLLRADGRAVHEAGGSEAQELAFTLAVGVEYLRVLESIGFSPDDARHRLSFIMAADADEFLTISKFRALRKLWAQVEEACGLKPKPIYISAETAWRMMTRRDPYVNMLRATVAAAAAGMGGANAVGVLPFTLALGLPNAFARRIARNTQLVLLEESNLAKVTDPAVGSGAIELLTSQLEQKAWLLFQEIESVGGAAHAVEQGLLQKKIHVTRAARQMTVACRRDALTGSSDYPNLNELPAATLDVPRVSGSFFSTEIKFEALPQMRLAEPYETLRDASDHTLAMTGARPKIFLANLGRLSDFTARAMYAKNFYEAGGVEAVTNDGFKNASGAKLACICSSDEVYEIDATRAVRTMAAAGAIVHLAGRPGDNESTWRQAGVKAFIFLGCDAVSTLQSVHDILGIK